MLKVASFKITDAEGMNDLLCKYKLATGMSILVSSSGDICIPYEDGQPNPKQLEACKLGEDINMLRAQMDTIEHSQQVMGLLLANAKERMDAAYTKHKAASSDKKLEAKFKEAESAHAQTENQILMNKQELTRLQANIDFYQEKIKALTA